MESIYMYFRKGKGCTTLWSIFASQGYLSPLCSQWTSDVCTMTTQRVPNAMDVWNTLGSRCKNVAGWTFGTRWVVVVKTSLVHWVPEQSGLSTLGLRRWLISITKYFFERISFLGVCVHAQVKELWHFIFVSFSIGFCCSKMREFG